MRIGLKGRSPVRLATSDSGTPNQALVIKWNYLKKLNVQAMPQEDFRSYFQKARRIEKGN